MTEEWPELNTTAAQRARVWDQLEGLRPSFDNPSHALAVGQLVSVTGASPSGYNVALVPVTAISTYTFSVAQTTNPGTWTSGGTTQADGVAAANGMIALDGSGNFNLYFSGSWHVIS